MLKSETYMDAFTGYTKQLIYELSADQKKVASMDTSYQTSGATQFTLWKTKNSRYGRTLPQLLPARSYPTQTAVDTHLTQETSFSLLLLSARKERLLSVNTLPMYAKVL